MAAGDPLHGAQAGPLTTFGLIHGKWHDPSCWELLEPRLRSAGYAVVTPELPLHREATYEERAQPAIDALADADGPVVLVGHSLGVAYSPLVAAARPVSLVVHLCPAPTGLFTADAPMPKTRPDFPWPPGDVWEREAAIAVMYPRLDPEIAAAAAGKLRPGAPSRGDYPLERHPDVPTALVYAAEDEFFEPDWERWVAREILVVEPAEIPGGHFPMLQDPAALADLLDRTVRANLEQPAP